MENQEQEMKALQEELAAMRAENEKLKGGMANRTLSFKVSAKGGVSVYGLQKFPVTFYQEQWLRLFGASQEIIAFININTKDLVTKKTAVVAKPNIPTIVKTA